MNLKDINTWWHRGMEKERRRVTNAPKPFTGDRFSVPENFSHFAPKQPRSKTLHAR